MSCFYGEIYGITSLPARAINEHVLRIATCRAAANRDITVWFNSDVADDMPWDFKPTQEYVRVKAGQSTLAFFTAHNKRQVFCHPCSLAPKTFISRARFEANKVVSLLIGPPWVQIRNWAVPAQWTQPCTPSLSKASTVTIQYGFPVHCFFVSSHIAALAGRYF